MVLLDWTPWPSGTLAAALSARYRVISIEPPESAPLPGSPLAAAETVAALLGGLQANPYRLIGVSLGADVAFRLALLHPESVDSLALVSPLCVSPRGPLPEMAEGLGADIMLAHPSAGPPAPPDPGRTAVLAALAEQWITPDSDAINLLSALNCTTLVALGQEDRLVSREAGALWKERVPNCNVCYVYDAGHALTVERPDALTGVVIDFVERRETFIVEKRSSLINP